MVLGHLWVLPILKQITKAIEVLVIQFVLKTLLLGANLRGAGAFISYLGWI